MCIFRKCKTSGKEIKQQEVNYSSLFRSMEKGHHLYNQLKVRCHPDKYVGTDKQSVAEDLFKLVQANCTNYEELLQLKDRIDKEL